MVLNNYRIACRASGAMKTLSNTSMSTNYNTVVCNNVTGGYYSVQNGGGYVDVGFGNTPEDADDYNLADSNSYGGTNVGALTWVSTAFINENPYLKRYATTYINNGAANVEVKEIGLVAKAASVTSNPSFTLLVARKVLDTPVVVPPGASVAFTYGIKA